jgi:hypothetical protein
MSLSYQDVFNLRPEFTMEELNQAYDDKLKNARKSIRNEIDRQLYLDSLAKYYEEARRDLYHSQSENDMFNTAFNSSFDSFQSFPKFAGNDMFNSSFSTFPSIFRNMENLMNRTFNNNSNVYSSSSSYSEKTLPDGSKLVVENNTTNKNGDLRRNTNSYRRLRDGRTEPVEYEEAMKHLQGNNQKSLM